jgi:UDPglucose 6-dehydrogenase
VVEKWNSNPRHLPLVDERGLRDLVRVTRDGISPTPVSDKSASQTAERPARKPNLVFSSDIEGCVRNSDMVFLCVDTPTSREGVSEGSGMVLDTRPLEKSVEDVARCGKEEIVVVVKSTVPVGTAGTMRARVSVLLEELAC